MSRLTLGVGEQVLHPVCYGQPYKIKRISYYPAVTRLADIEKKRFPLTDMVLAKQEKIACLLVSVFKHTKLLQTSNNYLAPTFVHVQNYSGNYFN